MAKDECNYQVQEKVILKKKALRFFRLVSIQNYNINGKL